MSINLLSSAELRVMESLNENKLYKEIAHEKGISINTVKKHLKNIYRKLEVKNRREACEEFSKLFEASDN